LSQQDLVSVDQSRGISRSTPLTFGPVGQNGVRRRFLDCLVSAESRLRLQNFTKHIALRSWRTYLIWTQDSPFDQDQTIDFVCRDLNKATSYHRLRFSRFNTHHENSGAVDASVGTPLSLSGRQFMRRFSTVFLDIGELMMMPSN
jgi:hypothetical protein